MTGRHHLQVPHQRLAKHHFAFKSGHQHPTSQDVPQLPFECRPKTYEGEFNPDLRIQNELTVRLEVHCAGTPHHHDLQLMGVDCTHFFLRYPHFGTGKPDVRLQKLLQFDLVLPGDSYLDWLRRLFPEIATGKDL